MSKQKDGIRRLLLILNKVRHGGRFLPKDELLEFVNKQMETQYDAVPVSSRTLERDIADIYSLFGVEIRFDRARQGYYVSEDYMEYDERIAELMMNFDLLNAIGSDNNLSSFVLAEHHRPAYSEWMMPLVKAIRDFHPVTFSYVNYRKDCAEKPFSVLPHYLKESNQRWCLLAYDGAVMKMFGVTAYVTSKCLKTRRSSVISTSAWPTCSATVTAFGTTHRYPLRTSNCVTTHSTTVS